MSWKRWPAVTALRRLKARARIPLLRRRTHPGREVSFWTLSTGRVGTRFLARVLDTATNADVRHQPGPQLRHTSVREAVRVWTGDRDAFWRLRVEDLPLLEEKVLDQLALPVEVYGDTLNHMFPFGEMLHRYVPEGRARIIHLVRHPVTCCRSILVSEKDWGDGGRFEELRPPEFLEGATAAEKAASVWNRVNEMAAAQVERIGDPAVARTVRLEDLELERIEELFGFLGLAGFDPARIRPLMRDDSQQVRHSHVDYHDEREVERWELERVAELCAEHAGRYGYEMDVDRALAG